MSDSKVFHPAGPPTFKRVHSKACPRCAGDVHAVEVAGSIAYWKCKRCGAAYGNKVVPNG